MKLSSFITFSFLIATVSANAIPKNAEDTPHQLVKRNGRDSLYRQLNERLERTNQRYKGIVEDYDKEKQAKEDLEQKLTEAKNALENMGATSESEEEKLQEAFKSASEAYDLQVEAAKGANDLVLSVKFQLEQCVFAVQAMDDHRELIREYNGNHPNLPMVRETVRINYYVPLLDKQVKNICGEAKDLAWSAAEYKTKVDSLYAEMKAATGSNKDELKKKYLEVSAQYKETQEDSENMQYFNYPPKPSSL
ncbi:hypothetical protein BASA50_004293 [Batrachochytrium salamandrivorans]|uniref:BAR domain-containing protein n=1 Tax=Batrachochytrium salamandrivorans TaxID=1357716 RepID=A0ABQ8FFZ3_9FUNG|nr:hypothetical protein BASA62_002637 [Batrachochytrium salamandrivorans]KAH6580481.1 hypothetical protein BASA61_009629 [Batrachochytrium salamandrivorans]KAH6581402.1 hypothetical protein BASA60_002459 [Batrachochytrium salamandrivorans]KAH6597688.1 hypothetical protein BASA50_004293 [Batrachochytrium salamandrivorans]